MDDGAFESVGSTLPLEAGGAGAIELAVLPDDLATDQVLEAVPVVVGETPDVADGTALRADEMAVGREVSVPVGRSAVDPELPDQAFVPEYVEIAINRAEGDVGHLLANALENPLGSGMALGTPKGLENEPALSGLTGANSTLHGYPPWRPPCRTMDYST